MGTKKQQNKPYLKVVKKDLLIWGGDWSGNSCILETSNAEINANILEAKEDIKLQTSNNQIIVTTCIKTEGKAVLKNENGAILIKKGMVEANEELRIETTQGMIVVYTIQNTENIICSTTGASIYVHISSCPLNVKVELHTTDNDVTLVMPANISCRVEILGDNICIENSSDQLLRKHDIYGLWCQKNYERGNGEVKGSIKISTSNGTVNLTKKKIRFHHTFNTDHGASQSIICSEQGQYKMLESPIHYSQNDL